jgi:hypothetical protein
MKFAAGGAVAKGAKVTVTTSGWFTSADSFDTVVGEAKAAVTSGSVGTGFFVFPQITDRTVKMHTSITAAAPLIAGIGVALDDAAPANNGEECAAIAETGIGSGDAGDVVIFGKTNIRMDPAQVASTGDVVYATTSGYFTPCDSGYWGNARALENIGSDSTGLALFAGVPFGYFGK